MRVIPPEALQSGAVGPKRSVANGGYRYSLSDPISISRQETNMATEMYFLLIEDSELVGLRGHADRLARIVDRQDSDGELVVFGVNHRNVDIFHFILNGTAAYSGGPRGLFDTWIHGDRYASIRLTDEAFGLNSRDVRILSDALLELDDETVSGRREEWKKSQGIVEDDDPAFFPECFGYLRELCSRAVEAKKALVWIAG